MASDLPTSPSHPFSARLNQLLAGNGFDPLVDKLRAPYYAETTGWPGGTPPREGHSDHGHPWSESHANRFSRLKTAGIVW